jgi:hypothetical protein
MGLNTIYAMDIAGLWTLKSVYTCLGDRVFMVLRLVPRPRHSWPRTSVTSENILKASVVASFFRRSSTKHGDQHTKDLGQGGRAVTLPAKQNLLHTAFACAHPALDIPRPPRRQHHLPVVAAQLHHHGGRQRAGRTGAAAIPHAPETRSGPLRDPFPDAGIHQGRDDAHAGAGRVQEDARADAPQFRAPVCAYTTNWISMDADERVVRNSGCRTCSGTTLLRC